MSESFTKAQEEAYDKAHQILTEHFDHVLIAVNTECPSGTDHASDIRWHGGRMACIGMAEYARNLLINKQ